MCMIVKECWFYNKCLSSDQKSIEKAPESAIIFTDISCI